VLHNSVFSDGQSYLSNEHCCLVELAKQLLLDFCSVWPNFVVASFVHLVRTWPTVIMLFVDLTDSKLMVQMIL
jgi:hypothetical protein